MTPNTLGFIFFGIALVSLGISGFHFKKNKVNAALAFLFITALFMRLSPMLDPYLHRWDERHHALVARNMIAHPLKPMLYADPALEYDDRNWGHNNIWLHKQPLALWSMALSMSVFGITEIAARFPSLLYSMATLLIIYGLTKRLYSHRAGYYAAMLFALNGFIIQVAAGRTPTDHIDTCFLFFITASIACVFLHHDTRQHRWLILAGLACGGAVLTKWLVGLLAIPILLTLEASRTSNSFFTSSSLQGGKAEGAPALTVTGLQTVKSLFANTLIVLGLAVLVAAPWQLYIFRVFPEQSAWEFAYNTRHFYEALEQHEGGVFFHITRLFSLYSELAIIPIISALFVLYKNKRMTRIAAGLAMWFVLPIIFFTIAATKMKGYTLPAIPAFFIICGLFLASFGETTLRRSHAVALTLLFVLLPLRGYIQKNMPFEPTDPESAWITRIRALPPPPPGSRAVLFGIDQYLNAMFYTDYTCYPNLPSQAIIDDLTRQGRKIYLYQEAGDPPDLENVTFLR